MVDRVAIAIPVFLLMVCVELVYGTVVGRNTYKLVDTISNLMVGTLGRLRTFINVSLFAGVFVATETRTGRVTLSSDDIWVCIAAFVGYDFCYYWAHRFSHESRILWATHVVHHQSECFNLSTALRHSSTGYLTVVFYLPLILIGFSAELIATVGAISLAYQFWVHTEHIGRLGPLEWILVTPSNHRVHHARNPEYLDKNHGGVFIVWDRLFGTFAAEDPTILCAYGITHPPHTLNPLWANLHVWFENLTEMRRAHRFVDRVLVWIKSPAWRPYHRRVTPVPSWRPTIFENAAPKKIQRYVLVQITSLIVGLLLARFATLDRVMGLLLLALALASLHTQATLLEMRRSALHRERIRLAAVGVTAWYGVIIANAWTPAVALVMSVHTLGSAATTLRFRPADDGKGDQTRHLVGVTATALPPERHNNAGELG